MQPKGGAQGTPETVRSWVLPRCSVRQLGTHNKDCVTDGANHVHDEDKATPRKPHAHEQWTRYKQRHIKAISNLPARLRCFGPDGVLCIPKPMPSSV